jgi:predicted permease
VLTDVDLWAPCSFQGNPFPDPAPRGGYFATGAIGLLKPGISITQARQRIASVVQGWRTAYPNDYPPRAGWAPRIIRLQQDVVGSVTPALLIVFGAVGLVLLIACANLANLLLARASSRQRELAVRRALGSSRWRLVRLMLIESMLLAGIGGVAGIGLTVWLLEALLALVPPGLPRIQEVAIDGQVLAFTAATAIVTALMFGTIPAVQYSKGGFNDSLKEGARGASSRQGWIRSGLVVAEFALALVLLVGAALLVRSFVRVQRVELGFEPRDVLTARLWLPQPNDPNQGKYSNRTTGHAARVALFEDILGRARALPGVTSAAAVGVLPLEGSRNTTSFTAEGTQADERSRIPRGQATIASAGYFELMGIRLLSGRTFTDQDGAQSLPVVVVSSSLARTVWPGQNPIGRRVHLGGPQANNPWMTVVGIVDDVHNQRPEDVPLPLLYRPLRQASGLSLALVLKVRGDPQSVAAPLAAAARAADPDQPTYAVRTMDDLMRTSTASRRFSMQLLGAFALLALGLAAVGIYGVMAFVVGQRTRELGIRIALGAHPSAVVRLVLREALQLAGAGVLAGLAAAALATRLLSGLLYQVRATDPATYGTIAVVLAGAAALAAWRPARRAATVDPIIALKAD